MLHIVNKSPFECTSLASCLRVAQRGAAVLLIEDGIYAATTGSAVAALGCGGPNNVRCGRIAARTAGVMPSTRPSSSRVSSGATGGP